MARYTGPIFKLSRREGISLSPKCTKIKRNYAPGQHGQSQRKLTQYGMQLRSKQALKRMYGLLEKQFKGYFNKAARSKEETGPALVKLLESRLDNVVFRMGFAVSRRQSRQLVNHGHVKINGTKVDKVSYLVKPGDVVEFKEKSKKIVPVEEAIEISKNISTPSWLEVNFDEVKGTFLRNPERDEVEIPVDIQSIIELYSK